MKINSKHMIIPALMTAVGIALVGSVSGTVAWYQYSTRVQTSFVGASAKCAEGLEVSLTGVDSAFHSELKTSDIRASALNNMDGSKFQPVTPNAAHATAEVATVPSSYDFKGHPKYQNFEYAKWAAAPDGSYLQYDLYFRVLDVDGQATKSYLAKNIYFEDFTVNFTAQTGVTPTDANAFKNALRFQFDCKTTGANKSILLSNTAGSTTLGAKLDLNNDGEFDKTTAYEWETGTETEYGDKTMTQVTASPATYTAPVVDGSLDPTGKTALGKTVAGAYAQGTALHYVVTIWLEGWSGTGDTAATSIWDAKNYIGDFQIGMRFGITDYGQE